MKGEICFISDDDWSKASQQLEQQLEGISALFILADENTREYCLPGLLKSLTVLQRAELLEIPSGESYKNLETCRGLWRQLNSRGADRQSVLINLGGGVICDLGGFVASVYKRGIRFYHFPTTLLAQVDAAIGGKVGIDMDKLKNHLGLFSEATGIVIFPGFLQTLSQQQLRSGFAEVIKIALIRDAEYWKEIKLLSAPESQLTDTMMLKAIALKLSITEHDFKDSGLRNLLNFGHTVGHALESLALDKGEAVWHGEAVAAGILCEAFISRQLGWIAPALYLEISQLIRSLFPRLSFTRDDIPTLMKLMEQDKKNVGTSVRFTLLKSPGEGVFGVEVSREIQEQALTTYLQTV